MGHTLRDVTHSDKSRPDICGLQPQPRHAEAPHLVRISMESNHLVHDSTAQFHQHAVVAARHPLLVHCQMSLSSPSDSKSQIFTNDLLAFFVVRSRVLLMSSMIHCLTLSTSFGEEFNLWSLFSSDSIIHFSNSLQ